MTGNTPVPASSVTINGQPAIAYADFTFASSNGLALADGLNSFTNIASNYYGTVSVTNTVTEDLPQSVTLQFDANGNLTNDGARVFAYDAENQLTNVLVAGQWREDFLYDGLNRRRITRQYTWQSGAWALTNETRFIYDGNVVVEELDSNNVTRVAYTRGTDLSGSLQGAGGIGGLLARTDANGPVFYHADGNGNVTSLMDTNQYIAARYLYDPYGRLLGKWGTLADANLYRFSSKEWDVSSRLYYYLYRFYDPTLQRWLNRDPSGENGGLHLYRFVLNNPITSVDLFGLGTWNIEVIASSDWDTPVIKATYTLDANEEKCCNDFVIKREGFSGAWGNDNDDPHGGNEGTPGYRYSSPDQPGASIFTLGYGPAIIPHEITFIWTAVCTKGCYGQKVLSQAVRYYYIWGLHGSFGPPLPPQIQSHPGLP